MKIMRGHLLTRGIHYTCTKFGNFPGEGSRHLSKTSSLTLIFDHVTCISIRVIYSLGVSIVPSLETFKQRGWVKRYWMDIIYTKTSSLTFTFDHVTWNLLLGASTIRSLRTFKQRGQDILSIDITWSTDRLRDLLLLTLIGCPTEQQWIVVETN